ncbi:DUF805 domain-containing protein [Plantibacter sp. ME-Dv--P-095]|uniref:DUF805 domain-containing protein n=1 Tax=Plantibacter sp. ME-Dv--P-095 TaxID=3040299 RepID=UPI002549F486|nr:DUF805 domain-containing protein [Plantibacter sp. ME-Dv--P-095]
MTYPPNPQSPSGQAPYGQQPYGQAPSGQQPYGQPQYGQAPYGQPQYQAPAPRGASSPDDLSLPLYGATFSQARRRFFKQYADFSGRASLSEYWWASLFTTLVMLIPTLLVTIGAALVAVTATTTAVQQQARYDNGYTGEFDGVDLGATGIGVSVIVLIVGVVLLLVAWVALFVPSLALTWRRLHDAGFPGTYYFFTLVPSVGSVIVLVMVLLPSKPEGQRFDVPAQVPAQVLAKG